MTTENTVVSTLHIRPNIPEFCSAFGKKENVKVESSQCRMSKETWRAQAESCTEQPERIHAIWKEGAHAKGFRIRGKTYMDDKVKIQAANPRMFFLQTFKIVTKSACNCSVRTRVVRHVPQQT